MKNNYEDKNSDNNKDNNYIKIMNQFLKSYITQVKNYEFFLMKSQC